MNVSRSERLASGALMVLAIVTHTDIDGVAAAALYLYLTGTKDYRVFFTEPFLLHKALDRVASAHYEKLVILDIGINTAIYREVLDYLSLLRKHEISIEWYDHHLWSDNWIKDLRNLGIELHIDTSTCTVGVVTKRLKPQLSSINERFVDEVTSGVCASDLWKFDHWLGPFYARLVRRKDKDRWRVRVLEVLASGKHWVEEFNDKVLQHVERELEALSSSIPYVDKAVNGLRILVAESNEKVENSILAAYIMGRYQADIVVLVSSDGKLSFRSRRVNVREIAVRFHGGGHLYASGAKITFPWWVRALAKISRRFLLKYVANLVSKTLRETSPHLG